MSNRANNKLLMMLS